MRVLTLVLCTIVLLATGLPMIDTAEWWIRIFDFPKLQIAVLTFLALILAFFYVDFKWKYKLPLLLILAASLVYQGQLIVVYTPFHKTQAKDSSRPSPETSFT
jgi:endonuclease/exonuclease/phosphatase (EEP) superfamily protein YafD